MVRIFVRNCRHEEKGRPRGGRRNMPVSYTHLDVYKRQAVLAVILFVAAQTQSMEYDHRFFQSFYAQYQGKLSNLSGQADGPAAVGAV